MCSKNVNGECIGNDACKCNDSATRQSIRLFDFGQAIKELKAGVKIARAGWNGNATPNFTTEGVLPKMFVVYQKGYPEGIECNKQTAEAWGLNEGDLFRCEPYLQIRMVNGSHAMWVPSINDVLAEDYYIATESYYYAVE